MENRSEGVRSFNLVIKIGALWIARPTGAASFSTFERESTIRRSDDVIQYGKVERASEKRLQLLKEFLVKLNLISWFIWAFVVLTMLGITYAHAVHSDTVLNQVNIDYINSHKPDPRITALTLFMEKHHFAPNQYGLIKNYLACADRFQTDWRLVPSIALAESSGGRFYPVRTSNFVGWNSANYTFQSEADAICFVSEKLANGSYYRNKSTKAKLNAYNPNPAYALRVIGFMNEIQLTK